MAITRRTVTKSIAWSVPAIAIAATIHRAAASEVCVPEVFFDTSESYKCCSGSSVKSMKLVVYFSNVETQCVPATPLCVTDVTLPNGQPIGEVVLPESPCILDLADQLVIYLLDVQSCPSSVTLEVVIAGLPPAYVDLDLTNLSDPGEETTGCVALLELYNSRQTPD